LDCRLGTASYRASGEGFGLTAVEMDHCWHRYLGASHGAPPWDAGPRVTAELGPLRDEGEQFAARLRMAGVPVRARRFAGQLHDALWAAGVLPGGARMLRAVAAELAST